MRTAEWINIVAFSFLTLLVWQPGLGSHRRMKIVLQGVAGLAITAVSAGLLPRVLPPLAASVIRDWLPYLLLLMFYWLAGLFVTKPNPAAERWLEQLDSRMAGPALAWCAQHAAGRWIGNALEAAYLFCYPFLPLGLTALYVTHHGAQADQYWAVVLISTYLCYAALPFLQTRPPRVVEPPERPRPPAGTMRALNLWVLRHGSIQANTLPSAHVAGSVASALVVLHFVPSIGIAFLGLAVCIALGAVAGRYHYAVDVILGAFVASAVFLAEIGGL